MTKAAEAPKSDFTALLADIGVASAETTTLAKALDKDADADDTIEAAAAEATDGEAKPGDGETAEGEKPLGKALKVIGEDGVEQEGIDAGPLLKSLVDRVEAGSAETKQVFDAMFGVIKQQGALLKSLTDQVQKLGSQGAGRRAVVTLHDKGGTSAEALAKSLEGGDGDKGDKGDKLDGKTFLLKASRAASEGKITHRDANYCETLINRGMQPPADIIRAVLA